MPEGACWLAKAPIRRDVIRREERERKPSCCDVQRLFVAASCPRAMKPSPISFRTPPPSFPSPPDSASPRNSVHRHHDQIRHPTPLLLQRITAQNPQKSSSSNKLVYSFSAGGIISRPQNSSNKTEYGKKKNREKQDSEKEQGRTGSKTPNHAHITGISKPTEGFCDSPQGYNSFG